MKILDFIKDTSLTGLIMKGSISIIMVAAICFSCSTINKKFGLSDDNFIEETIEQQIKNQTGMDIDLTPGSQE